MDESDPQNVQTLGLRNEDNHFVPFYQNSWVGIWSFEKTELNFLVEVNKDCKVYTNNFSTITMYSYVAKLIERLIQNKAMKLLYQHALDERRQQFFCKHHPTVR